MSLLSWLDRLFGGEAAPRRTTSVVLRQISDSGGTRHLSASLGPSGELKIDGHDVGRGVESVFGEGNREYEWVWTLKAEAVKTLDLVLSADGDVLKALAARFSGENAGLLGGFLAENEIPYEVPWSRVGD